MPIVCLDNAEIYYEVHGDGPVVALAHGSGGNTLSWYQQVPYLTKRYRVIALDFRGFGRSRRQGEEINVRQLTADLLAVLDSEQVERCALVSHDVGGFASLRLALDYPERVACLVLSSSAGGVMTPEMLAGLSSSSLRFSRDGAGVKMVVAPAWAKRNPERLFLLEQIYGLNEPLEPGILARIVEARIESEELAGFDTPTLVLSGGRDAVLGRGVLARAAGQIPGSKHLELPEAGHALHFERADEFNRTVSEFVAQHLPE